MDINAKLDRIIELLENLSDKQDEQHEEVLDAISNLSPGGQGYRFFDADEGD
jgi:hypothetical protein